MNEKRTKVGTQIGALVSNLNVDADKQIAALVGSMRKTCEKRSIACPDDLAEQVTVFMEKAAGQGAARECDYRSGVADYRAGFALFDVMLYVL